MNDLESKLYNLVIDGVIQDYEFTRVDGSEFLKLVFLTNDTLVIQVAGGGK